MKFLGAVDTPSKIVIVSAPYESDAVFRKGASNGPDKIRWASDSIEEFSIYSRLNMPYFNDLGDIDIQQLNPEKMVERVKDDVAYLLRSGRKVLLLGGDHLTALGSIIAHSEFYPNLKVLHFDAHLDRRESYLNQSYNYATIIKLVEDKIGVENVYSFGIRSIAKEETTNPNIFEFSVLEPLKQVINYLKEYPCYMTFDFDVLDPAVFPAVTNPEPCGIGTREAIQTIQLISDYLVGADFVEYNSLLDTTGRSGVLASILIREILINWGRR